MNVEKPVLQYFILHSSSYYHEHGRQCKKIKKCFFPRKCGSEMAHAVSTIQYITGMILPHILFLQLEIAVLLLLPRNAV